MALNVEVTCDLWTLTGEECYEAFLCSGAIPEAAITGPFLRSGWVQFIDDWSFRPDKHYGWLTLCPKHVRVECTTTSNAM